LTDGGGVVDANIRSSDGSGLPVIFKWTHGGQQVQLVGSFNNWQPIQMVRSGIEFSVALDLPRGVYKYRFVVDNEHKYAQDQPVTNTETGMQNVLDTLNYKRFEPQTELDDMDLDVESLEYGTLSQDVEPIDGQYSGPPTVPLVLYKSPACAAPLVSGFGPLAVRDVDKSGPSRSMLAGNSPPLLTSQVLVRHVYHDGGTALSTYGIDALCVSTTIRYKHAFSTVVYAVPDSLSTATRSKHSRSLSQGDDEKSQNRLVSAFDDDPPEQSQFPFAPPARAP
jgi:hypothetical protein